MQVGKAWLGMACHGQLPWRGFGGTLAAYGLGTPAQSQNRAAQAEPFQVRRGYSEGARGFRVGQDVKDKSYTEAGIPGLAAGRGGGIGRVVGQPKDAPPPICHGVHQVAQRHARHHRPQPCCPVNPASTLWCAL